MACMHYKENGFTLIELMIAIVVVAILASIAYPSYQEQVRKSRRADALEHLQQLSIAQERYYTKCNAYTSTFGNTNPANCAGLVENANSKLGYYSVAITHPGSASPCDHATGGANPLCVDFTLTATPVAGTSQANDSDCASISLTSAGVRSSLDDGGTASSCWPS